MTSSSENLRIWSWMAACVSSRPRIAEGDGVGLRGDEVGEALLDVLRAAGGDHVGDLVLVAAHVGARHAELLGTHELELAHGNAAGDLREVFGEGGGEQQLLELAEARLRRASRVPQTCIWRRPSTAVASQARPCA